MAMKFTNIFSLKLTNNFARNVRGRLKRISVNPNLKASYKSIDQMWEVQMNNQKPTYKIVDPVGSLKNWYQKANQYWKKSDATYNGVLSGFGSLSQIDIKGSQKFLNNLKIQNPKLKFDTILDCGAGIGRISKQLFCRYFNKVDVIDQCQNYIQKAKEILKGLNVRHFYCQGLQQFNFEQKYDIIWIQWVLSQLTDKDAVEFLIKAKMSLNKGGMIVMKQNHCQKGFLVDKTDYSVTRSSEMYKALIQKAGLKIVKQQLQQQWDKQLFDVKMYALI